MPHAQPRRQQDLAPGLDDLRRQIGIAPKLAVALIDLADGLDEVNPRHEGGAARIPYRLRFFARGLGRAPLAIRRKASELRRGPAFAIHQQGAHRHGLGMGVQHVGQPRTVCGSTLGVVVQEQARNPHRRPASPG